VAGGGGGGGGGVGPREGIKPLEGEVFPQGMEVGGGVREIKPGAAGVADPAMPVRLRAEGKGRVSIGDQAVLEVARQRTDRARPGCSVAGAETLIGGLCPARPAVEREVHA